MDVDILFKKLKGIHTIETVMDSLGVTRKKAIYSIYRLRNEGYVKTKRLSDNKRVYNISFENKLGGVSYTDVINSYTTFKIAEPKTHYIYGRKPSIEETLVHAISSGSLRKVIATLPLFNKLKNWSLLYRLAKDKGCERMIGALYDVTRKVMLTRKMPKRYKNNALPKKNDAWQDIIPQLSSEDFKDIEVTWKVHIPFNKNDLEAYA